MMIYLGYRNYVLHVNLWVDFYFEVTFNESRQSAVLILAQQHRGCRRISF